MATIKKFEDLEIWQQARKINIKLYPYIKLMYHDKNFALCRQIDAASGSVMDNIAEGFSRDGNKELIQFLSIAKGSLGEVRSQLYRLFDRDLIKQEAFENLQKDCVLLTGKISSFINYLKRSEYKGVKFKAVP